MLCMISTDRDPFFNLAFEEYLLRQEKQDVFILWQSLPAVVVGKHQNALAEVNYRFIRDSKILLARRLSGGGTVFHGPGNLNFTYIMQGEVGKLVDFRRFIEPVVHFLSTLGIEAVMGPRNEILVGGKKVSGNAEHVHKSRVLHHGTLLFKADLSMLRESIRVIPGRYVDKAVQSNRSSVTNLADHLPGIPDLDAFGKLFLQYMLDRFRGEIYHPAEETMMAVRELSKIKYNSWEWIYGWSPDYEFQGDAVCPAGIVHVHLKVHRGVVISCSLQSSQLPGVHLRSLENCITGCRHESDTLETLLRNWEYTGCENENCLKDLLFGFF